MRYSKRLLAIGLVVIAGIALAGVTAIASGPDHGTKNNVLGAALAAEQGGPKKAHRADVSGGVVNAALDFTGALEAKADAAKKSGGGSPKPFSSNGTQGCQNTFKGGKGGVDNVRVNQDCSLRRQAEETLAIDPNNPDHMIAGQNDSRIGFNHCGYDWTFDGGKTWGDQVPPFYQFVMADGHTADACSDPTATFDSKGNAYIGGVLFDINSAASAFVVMKSNAGIGGAFYHTPNSALSFQEYRDTPVGVVASDNNPNVFHDKEFIVADANASSPKADNVYGTWTRFTATNSPIYFSQSTDGGATWSAGIEISGANAAACTAFSGSANADACDQDQGSHPVVGSDGTIYVAFGNGNTPLPNINQVMMVSCPATADCSLAASWTAPAKVGDMIDTQPAGPSAAGCPGGRGCLPPNGYRLTGFVTISAAVDQAGKLYVSWADFRNGAANCNPNGPAATATTPCDNDVFYAYSTNGGATWSSTTRLTPPGSAQWQSWGAVAPDGKKYYVAYYDRSYGTCETDGCNDITLATVEKAATASPTIKYTRITTSSMPNLTPATNPIQAGFLGDYMWVATDSKGKPSIVWADTRGLGGTVEEDIYFATIK